MNQLMLKMLHNGRVVILLAVLLLISVNVLADKFLRSARLDLTEAGLYSMSDGTIAALQAAKDPVDMTFYFSRKLSTPYPSLLSYGKRIEDLLKLIAIESGGHISLRVVDPEPFSEIEDEAVAQGIKGVPLPTGESLYLGLYLADDADGSATIPFFAEGREKFLEYDVVKTILSLATEGRPKLTLLTQLPMEFGAGGPQAAMQGRAKPFVIYEQMQESFDMTMLPPSFDQIPADTDVLMVAHPAPLSDDQLLVIDQYVLKGGKAVFFVDPHNETAAPGSAQANTSQLDSLFGAWGITIDSGKIIGDLGIAQRISMGGYGPDSVMAYPLWLNVGADQLASDDVVAGSVENLAMASVGAIEAADSHVEVVPLVQSSPDSAMVDVARATGRPDPASVTRDLMPDNLVKTMAARLSGSVKTAYPDKVAAPKTVSETTGVSTGVSEGQINVVVVADTDMLHDRFWVQEQNLLGQRLVMPTAGNGPFVLGLLEQMSGSTALIDLRGRGVSNRPFTLVNAIRLAAESQYLEREKVLEERLKDAETRLAQLEETMEAGTSSYSAQKETEVEKFREQMLETRRALRKVKRSLRTEIEQLESRLIFVNAILMPLLVSIFGYYWLARRRRRGRNRSRS